MTTRLRIAKTGPSIGREYHAYIILDENVVGRVERQQSNKMLGYRAADYRAFIDGKVVATGATLRDLREELRAHFAAEYPDAAESW